MWALATTLAGLLFYRIPGAGVDLVHSPEDAELVEIALTIFIKSWGREQYGKLMHFVSSGSPMSALAKQAGLSTYLYKTEIENLLHKAEYCIDYVEKNPDKFR